MRFCKILLISSILVLPKSLFGIAGFGLNVISDGTKLGAYTSTETDATTGVTATVESFEMEKLPVGGGGYIFVDIGDWALEAEANIAGGEFSFNFGNDLTDASGNNLTEPLNYPFAWGRLSTAVTVKKNITDFSIPVLAETALSVGLGINNHTSTPRPSMEMVKGLLPTGVDITEQVDTDALQEELIDYLKDNLNKSSGFHAQLGLRFRLLVLDTHLTLRYNLAEDVYDGSSGFAELQLKVGTAF